MHYNLWLDVQNFGCYLSSELFCFHLESSNSNANLLGHGDKCQSPCLEGAYCYIGGDKKPSHVTGSGLVEVSTQSYGNACLGRLFMMEETGMVSWSIHPTVPPKGEGVSPELGIRGTRNEAYTGIEEREIAACLEYCW